MRNRSHFQRFGRGVFKCGCCGRPCRVVDQSNDTICQQCWDLAGLDNMVNDDGGGLDKVIGERDALLALAVRRGGDAEWIKKSNRFLWPRDKVQQEGQ